MLPGQVVSRLKSRLGANAVDINCRIRGKPSPTREATREKLRDWFMGAWEELDPLGVIDGMVRDHQAGDGVGFYEIELRPTFTPPAHNPNVDDTEYDNLVEDARRGYGLPVSLSAPDPRSLYWLESQGRLKIVTKVVNVPLIDLSGAYSGEGFRIAYNAAGSSGKGAYEKVPIVGGEEPPINTAWANWGRRVRFVRIADDSYIYDCMFPLPSGQDAGLMPMEFFQGASTEASQGGVPQLEILASYPNTLGHPPFYWAPALLQPHPDPALRVKPLAAEILDMAGYMNSIRTVRMIRGVMNALAPTHFKPTPMAASKIDPADSKQEAVQWKPGIQTLDGDLMPMPVADMADFDKLDAETTKEYQQYQLSIMSSIQSGMVGSRTPAWSVMMITEDNNTLIVDALNSRAAAIQAMLLDVAKVCKDRGEPVYVLAHQMDQKKISGGEHDEMISADPADLKTPFILDVKIHAETQSQLAASTEYWRLLHTEGTISDETYESQIGIEDRIAEQRRKDYEAIQKPMIAAGRLLGMELAKRELVMLYGPIADEIVSEMQAAAAPQAAMVTGDANPQTGEIGGGPSSSVGKGPSSPGQGQGLQLADHVTNQQPTRLSAPGNRGAA